MKKTYTTFQSTLSFLCKRTGKTPDETLSKIMSKNVNDYRDAKYGLQELAHSDFLTFRNALVIEHGILSGSCIHVYMPNKAFCDWIVSCINSLSPENAGILQEELGEDKSICLHFPTGEGLYSIGFVIPIHARVVTECENDPETYDIRKYSTLNSIFSRDSFPVFPNPARTFNLDGRDLDEYESQDKDSLWYAKLIVGLGQYLSCFPEQLKDGIPEDLKHPSHHNNKINKCISICPKIINDVHGSHSSPQAHYRVGHFRVLNSEFYTKKRYHVIFVEGTFVKGRAKHVLEIA